MMTTWNIYRENVMAGKHGIEFYDCLNPGGQKLQGEEAEGGRSSTILRSLVRNTEGSSQITFLVRRQVMRFHSSG